jgi:hypothetical protein
MDPDARGERRRRVNAGELVVVVEEQINGYHKLVVVTEPVTDADAAAKRAYDLALGHRPENPGMPKERTLFRRPDGSWLVRVRGAVSKHHFTVSVLEVEGTHPE